LLKAPLGNCVFKPEYEKIGFLIGGIGITPAISIIEYIARNIFKRCYIVYTNRNEDDIAFGKELEAWRSSNCNIRIVYTVTDCQPKDQKCVFGRIDKGLVSANIKDLNERVMFIFGPPRWSRRCRRFVLNWVCRKKNIRRRVLLGIRSMVKYS